MNYYTIQDDIGFKDRWYLGDLSTEDNWVFTYGKPINPEEFKDLSVEVDQKGVALDFTETDAYNVPIVSEDFAEIFFDYTAFIQLIPVSVPESRSNHYVFVIKNLVDCLDEKNSNFKKFELGNDLRPDKAGEYQTINIMKIDSKKVDAPIFRLANYDIVIVVNEEVKTKIDNAKLCGIKFKLVS